MINANIRKNNIQNLQKTNGVVVAFTIAEEKLNRFQVY
jgi:hypothetical protein